MPVASVVARIKAADADVGPNAEMEYKIVDGDGLGVFKISVDKDTQEGIITIQKVSVILPTGSVWNSSRCEQVMRLWVFVSKNLVWCKCFHWYISSWLYCVILRFLMTYAEKYSAFSLTRPVFFSGGCFKALHLNGNLNFSLICLCMK